MASGSADFAPALKMYRSGAEFANPIRQIKGLRSREFQGQTAEVIVKWA